MKKFIYLSLILLVVYLSYFMGIKDAGSNHVKEDVIETEVTDTSLVETETTEVTPIDYAYVLGKEINVEDLPYFSGALCYPSSSTVTFEFTHDNDIYSVTVDNSKHDLLFSGIESLNSDYYISTNRFHVLDTEGDLISVTLSLVRDSAVDYLHSEYGSDYSTEEFKGWVLYKGSSDIVLTRDLNDFSLLLRIPICNDITEDNLYSFCEELLSRINLKPIEGLTKYVSLNNTETSIALSDNILLKPSNDYYIDYWVYSGLENDSVLKNCVLYNTTDANNEFIYEVNEYTSDITLSSISEDYTLVPMFVNGVTLYKAYVTGVDKLLGVYFEVDDSLYSIRVINNYITGGKPTMDSDRILEIILEDLITIN